MKISKDARKVSRELFRASLKEGQLDPARIRAISAQLASSKPRHYLEILQAYVRLIRLELAKRQALIESAHELDEGARRELEETLRQKYGADVTTEFKVVPELIGGLRIKIGSDVFDSTIRERLNRLQATALPA